MDVDIFQKTGCGVKPVNSFRKFKRGQISGSALSLAMEATGAFNESRLEGSREDGACSGGRKEGGVCALEGPSPSPGPDFFNFCH